MIYDLKIRSIIFQDDLTLRTHVFSPQQGVMLRLLTNENGYSLYIIKRRNFKHGLRYLLSISKFIKKNDIDINYLMDNFIDIVLNPNKNTLERVSFARIDEKISSRFFNVICNKPIGELIC